MIPYKLSFFAGSFMEIMPAMVPLFPLVARWENKRLLLQQVQMPEMAIFSGRIPLSVRVAQMTRHKSMS